MRDGQFLQRQQGHRERHRPSRLERGRDAARRGLQVREGIRLRAEGRGRRDRQLQARNRPLRRHHGEPHRPARGGDRPRRQHAERGRVRDARPRHEARDRALREDRAHGRHDSLLPRRPQHALHRPHRVQRHREPRRRRAYEPLRAPRHRRDDQLVRRRGDQERVRSAPRDRRVDWRDGPHRAGRRLRPPVRKDFRLPGQGRRLARQRRQALHHERLRRGASRPRPHRARVQRRTRLKLPSRREGPVGQGAPPREQARHPRLAHVRDGLHRGAREADRSS